MNLKVKQLKVKKEEKKEGHINFSFELKKNLPQNNFQFQTNLRIRASLNIQVLQCHLICLLMFCFVQ